MTLQSPRRPPCSFGIPDCPHFIELVLNLLSLTDTALQLRFQTPTFSLANCLPVSSAIYDTPVPTDLPGARVTRHRQPFNSMMQQILPQALRLDRQMGIVAVRPQPITTIRNPDDIESKQYRNIILK